MSKMTYAQAGVDIHAGEAAVQRIKSAVRSTFTPGVMTDIGGFGGLFRLDRAAWRNPVLVASTDGVGTKLLVARMAGRYGTIGQCLVNHCVNDIFAQGAHPLFFLDYIGVGRLEPDVIESIISGLAVACRQHGLALIGGEMAEMPDVYRPDDFDLVGTIVGVVEQDMLVTGSAVTSGDVVVGFPSTGLHTNGYTLARRILFDRAGLTFDSQPAELDVPLGEALLAVHRSYYHLLAPWTSPARLHAMAHITGGGIPGNLKRVIPQGMLAEIDTHAWEIPPLFRFLEKQGDVERDEMYRAFNMGVGYIVVTDENSAADIIGKTDGFVIGRIVASAGTDRVRLLS